MSPDCESTSSLNLDSCKECLNRLYPSSRPAEGNGVSAQFPSPAIHAEQESMLPIYCIAEYGWQAADQGCTFAAFEALKLLCPLTAWLNSRLPFLQACRFRHHKPQLPPPGSESWDRGSSTTGWHPLQQTTPIKTYSTLSAKSLL